MAVTSAPAPETFVTVPRGKALSGGEPAPRGERGVSSGVTA